MSGGALKEIESRRKDARSLFSLADNRVDSSFTLEDTFEVPLLDEDPYNLVYFSSYDFDEILKQ